MMLASPWKFWRNVRLPDFLDRVEFFYFTFYYFSHTFHRFIENPLTTKKTTEIPKSFKGIALFTPGGDVIYCIDANKQGRWHLHLCAALQEYLGLSEPPHFLFPGYTATVDRWLDPRTQQVKVFAEAYPPVIRHQGLLNLLFDTGDLVWACSHWPEDLFYPMVLGKYHQKFPILWQTHQFIFRCDPPENFLSFASNNSADKSGKVSIIVSANQESLQESTQEYVFHLFVSGRSAITQRTMEILHQILEDSLGMTYTLKVIDISRHPEQTEIYQITATPTLVKIWPLPMRKIVGDLENLDKLRQVLSTFR